MIAQIRPHRLKGLWLALPPQRWPIRATQGNVEGCFTGQIEYRPVLRSSIAREPPVPSGTCRRSLRKAVSDIRLVRVKPRNAKSEGRTSRSPRASRRTASASPLRGTLCSLRAFRCRSPRRPCSRRTSCRTSPARNRLKAPRQAVRFLPSAPPPFRCSSCICARDPRPERRDQRCTPGSPSTWTLPRSVIPSPCGCACVRPNRQPYRCGSIRRRAA